MTNKLKIPVLAHREEEFIAFLYRQHKNCREHYFYAFHPKDLRGRNFNTFIVLEGFWATPNPNANELYELAGFIVEKANL